MSRRSRLAAAVAGLAGTCTVLAAQQAPPTATFRASVDLVTVDVRVLDKSGQPIPGLTAEDFTVMLDGKPSPVRLVDFLVFPTRPRGTAGAPMAITAAAPPASSSPGAARPGRSILFGVDTRSIRVEDMPPFSQIISRAIGLLGDDDLAGLIVPGGQSVPASRDRTALLKAVRGLTGRRVLPPVPVFVGVEESRMYQMTRNQGLFTSVVERECGETSGSELETCVHTVEAQFFSQGALLERDVNTQLESVFDMIEAARALPPPRILVLCSNGNATWTDKLVDFKPVSEMALRADVQIEYLTEPPPNLDSASQVRTNFARGKSAASLSWLRDEDEKFLRRGGDNVAEMMGAPIHRFTSGTDPALEALLAGWSASYRLGMQPPENAGLSRLVSLKVAVNRPGATVYANRRALLNAGAMAAADARTFGMAAPPGPAGPPPAPTPETRLADAVTSTETTGVTLSLGAAARRDEAGRDVQVVTLQAPKDMPGPIKAQFAVLDEAGKVVQRGTPEMAAGTDDIYRSVFSVPLAPGRYRLRAAGIDAGDRLSIGELGVEVKPMIVGSVAVSDILLLWKDDNGRSHLQTGSTIPASAETVQASIEFYAARPGGTVVMPVVQMSIAREGQATPIADWTPTARTSMQGGQAAVVLPWDSLDPGRYIVSATVSVGTAAPITLTRSITKGS